MVNTSLFPPVVLRVTSAALLMIQNVLMLSGVVLMLALAGLLFGHSAVVDGLSALLPQAAAAAEVAAAPASEPESPSGNLSPRMRGALENVSRRYRVSMDALQPIFSTVESAGRELNLDPLLIVAVIGVESGFNPFSQSVVGAQGLMQVVPYYHRDKLPSDAGALSFFHPLTNVQVGARILKESISRNGGVENGLQQFAGALNDPERRYAAKVLAERQRLEQGGVPRVSPVASRAVSAEPADLAENQEKDG